MIVVKVFAMFGDRDDHVYSQTSLLMFTFRKSRLVFTVLEYRFLSGLLVFIIRVSIHLSRPCMGILFWLMNLPNWTITLYFSTSEFKLDTLLSGLACHSNYGEKIFVNTVR